ncbi:hypothetical protein KQX54_017235 [Cotesia glomerata]|uniref:Uncharacterized protein n=1 Tax=Cotesia glomerata TaxID=32391 RepID=A0AAV7HW15_COTGL|nr:hypothetical protein KQX54_017235 [Cotesia glomerata]
MYPVAVGKPNSSQRLLLCDNKRIVVRKTMEMITAGVGVEELCSGYWSGRATEQQGNVENFWCYTSRFPQPQSVTIVLFVYASHTSHNPYRAPLSSFLSSLIHFYIIFVHPAPDELNR